MEFQRESAPVSIIFAATFKFCLPLHSCLEHVVNLVNITVMGHIMKIAIIENTNAIWEYDPELSGNHVLGGSLDVVAAI